MTDTFATPLEDPALTSIMEHFQLGEWSIGLEKLEQLKEKYPVSQELENLQKQIQVQARISEYEIEEKRRSRAKKMARTTTRIVGALVLLGVIFAGIMFYSGRIQQQFNAAQEKLDEQVKRLDLSAKFRRAQDYLQAGQFDKAEVLFKEVKEADPEFPNVDIYIGQLSDLETLDAMYLEAIQLKESGDQAGALEKFREIQDLDSYFRDVPQQIDGLEQGFLLDEVYADATTAFDQSQWADAISSFESLRSFNADYQQDSVEEMLFQSYLNLALEVIMAEDNPEALDTPEGMAALLDDSETLVRKALALRPQDDVAMSTRLQVRTITQDRIFNYWVGKAQEVFTTQTDSLAILDQTREYYSKALEVRQDESLLLQLALLEKYLNALDSFDMSDWTDVITDLEYVYDIDPNFADGTARQTLFDALMARGEELLSGGDYQGALSDFERASVISQQADPVSTLQVYEAQRKLAYTYGLLLDYENAVLIYQSALQTNVISQETLFENPTLANLLTEATLYAQQGAYRNAYLRYREALSSNEQFYDYDVHVVQEGDYLTSIARLYKSTVQAIAELNDITNLNKIYVGQELLVPKLSGN